jgi:lysophospholipase
MTNANDNLFTSESQLAHKYTNEIADFWLTGEFAQFNGVNDTRINFATFIHKPATNKAEHKCLVISSGRSEGYLKYKELSFDLFNLGFNVFLIDHRGQGLSERALENPNKGYVKSFQYYVDDLAYFIDNIVSPHCSDNNEIQKPFLLAHSMGGAIAARYLQDNPDKIEAAVLSSPMLGFNGGGIPDAVAKPIIHITAQLNQWFGNEPWYFLGHSDFTASNFSDNLLTHSSLRFQLFNQVYQDTPVMQLGGVTIKWLTEAIAALETIFNNVSQLTTPTLVIQAGADKIVSNQAQDDFCQRLHQSHPHSCPTGKPFVVKGASHELFFEQDIYRQQALTEVLNWFEKYQTSEST